MRRIVAASIFCWLAASPCADAQTSISNLMRGLESDKAAVRVKAAQALGNCGKGARSAAPALRALLDREQEPSVIVQTIKALTQIGAVAELQSLLQHSNGLMRQNAIWGLGVIGPPAKNATPALITALKDIDPLVRGQAIQALGEIGLHSEEEGRSLLKLLHDANPQVRIYAQTALINSSAASIPALEKLLDDKESVFVRSAAVQILASQGPEARSVVPALIPLLKEPDANLRLQSATALGLIGWGAKDALPALFEALLDPNGQVQSAAYHAAMTIGMENRKAFADGLRQANERGRWADPGKRETVAVLLKNLKHQDVGTRLTAALALGHAGKEAEPAIPSLTEALKDASPQVRSAARQALAMIDQKNREAYLRKVQSDQAQFLQEAQRLRAKLHADQRALLQQTNSELGDLHAQLYREQMAILQRLRFLPLKAQAEAARLNAERERLLILLPKAPTAPDNLTLKIATQDREKQAYIRQLIHMHMAQSTMRGDPIAQEWVRDEILKLGTEAVPALAQGYKMAIDFQPGFV